MKKTILLQFILITALALQAFGQKSKDNPSGDTINLPPENLRLFDSKDILNISLRFDVSTFLRKKSATDYLKAIITFHFSENDTLSKEIKLRSRGIFRNLNCYYPPVELNLKKSGLQYAVKNGFSKIKLATQCNAGGDYENWILREYLAYKMYNVMTDTSFRVRLVKINYIDTGKKRKPITLYGFFIEPMEMLMTRKNSVEIASRALTQKSIYPSAMDRIAIFNYMIGNYDWAVPNQHNIKVMKSLNFEPGGLAMAIPYDFDFTGLVNPSYAIPAEITGTDNIRQRIFLGVCRSREVFMNDLIEFKEKKEKLFSIINDFPYLDQNSKKDMIKYLNEFYDIIDEKMLIDIFINSCKRF
jgi:hypothetical protein